jgi:general secretion pathway protein D
MKYALLFVLIFAGAFSKADNLINFNFNNEELSKVIETYSKAANQKFVVDSSLRGKATILMPDKISVEEAFNQLSSALALQGYGISKQVDTMVVMSARNIQRNLIETSTTVPNLKPERMATWIYTPKYPAGDIFQNLRIVSSKDGEMVLYPAKNQIIMTDWTSNLHRLNTLFAELDKPLDAATAKLVDRTQKEKLWKKAQLQKEKSATE